MFTTTSTTSWAYPILPAPPICYPVPVCHPQHVIQVTVPPRPKTPGKKPDAPKPQAAAPPQPPPSKPKVCTCLHGPPLIQINNAVGHAAVVNVPGASYSGCVKVNCKTETNPINAGNENIYWVEENGTQHTIKPGEPLPTDLDKVVWIWSEKEERWVNMKSKDKKEEPKKEEPKKVEPAPARAAEVYTWYLCGCGLFKWKVKRDKTPHGCKICGVVPYGVVPEKKKCRRKRS